MKNTKIFLIATLFTTFVLSGTANAATLYFQPSAVSAKVGETVTVTVMVNTAGEAVNALSAYAAYPTATLQALGVNTAASAFTLVAEKQLSAGQLKLSAGQPSPGVNGVYEVATLTFKALAQGSVTLQLSDSSAVLSNSTNQDVLTSKGAATIAITAPAAAATPAPTQTQTAVQPTQTRQAEEATEEPQETIYKVETGVVTSIPLLEKTQTVQVSINDQVAPIGLYQDNGALIVANKTDLAPLKKDEVGEINIGETKAFGLYMGEVLQVALTQDLLAPALMPESEQEAESGDAFSFLSFPVLIIATLLLIVVAFGVVFLVARKRKARVQQAAPAQPAQNLSANPSEVLQSIQPTQAPQQPVSEAIPPTQAPQPTPEPPPAMLEQNQNNQQTPNS